MQPVTIRSGIRQVAVCSALALAVACGADGSTKHAPTGSGGTSSGSGGSSSSGGVTSGSGGVQGSGGNTNVEAGAGGADSGLLVDGSRDSGQGGARDGSADASTGGTGSGGQTSADAGPDAADSGRDAALLTCGNGVIDPGEECDNPDLGGATCATATMNARPVGYILCTDKCQFDVTHCRASGTVDSGAGGSAP